MVLAAIYHCQKWHRHPEVVGRGWHGSLTVRRASAGILVDLHGECVPIWGAKNKPVWVKEIGTTHPQAGARGWHGSLAMRRDPYSPGCAANSCKYSLDQVNFFLDWVNSSLI